MKKQRGTKTRPMVAHPEVEALASATGLGAVFRERDVLVTFHISAQAAGFVRSMLETGLFGSTPEQVVREIVYDGLRRRFPKAVKS